MYHQKSLKIKILSSFELVNHLSDWVNHLISKISEKYNIQTFQNRIDCPHTTSRSISNWSWNLLTFQNFHLWVENFKNRNRSIPDKNSIPELGFGFFDVKTLLYIKKGQCEHVLVALHNYLIQNLIFWKTHKWLQTEKLLN